MIFGILQSSDVGVAEQDDSTTTVVTVFFVASGLLGEAGIVVGIVAGIVVGVGVGVGDMTSSGKTKLFAVLCRL